MQNAVDKNFDLFELYVLRNIFRVPANVQIPTDKVKRVSPIQFRSAQQLVACLFLIGKLVRFCIFAKPSRFAANEETLHTIFVAGVLVPAGFD
jgi:hypothetical protein